MKIELECNVDALKEFFKVKGDKSSRIWFDADASQAAKVVQLILVPTDRMIKVTIEFHGDRNAA